MCATRYVRLNETKCRYSLHEASILHPCDLWAKKPLQRSQPTTRRLIDLEDVLCSRLGTPLTIKSRMLFDTTRKLQKTTRGHYKCFFLSSQNAIEKKTFWLKAVI